MELEQRKMESRIDKAHHLLLEEKPKYASSFSSSSHTYPTEEDVEI